MVDQSWENSPSNVDSMGQSIRARLIRLEVLLPSTASRVLIQSANRMMGSLEALTRLLSIYHSR